MRPLLFAVQLQQHGDRAATMLLPSKLGEHVGETSAHTDTAVVGERAAQGRTVRTGYSARLTG